MTDVPKPETVEKEDEYIHVRYRDPDGFERIRTPDWADEVSDSVVDGSEVRMGALPDSDDWEIQSVLIPKESGKEAARSQAEEIFRKIES